MLLQGALAAEGMVGLKLNVEQKNLPAVLKLLGDRGLAHRWTTERLQFWSGRGRRGRRGRFFLVRRSRTRRVGRGRRHVDVAFQDQVRVLQPGEEPFEAQVRYRTVGDMTCTAAVESDARTVEDVIAEVASFRVGERGATRVDDKFSDAAMEDRKKEGYF